jgi:acyl transferase domain-containing protein
MRASGSEIAVVGMSGRFPGARNVRQFWTNLRNGVESISIRSQEHIAYGDVPKCIATHPNAVFAGGVLPNFEYFDADFFGITPKEAEVMDPQHRVFLQHAWEALEDAGCDPERYPGRIGIFASVSPSAYYARLQAYPELAAPLSDFQVLTSNDKDFLATRVSYKLNLKGPSITVQTGCSSSLVAVHLACQSILSGESDACLAGGVSIKFISTPAYIFVPGGILAPDGHCRAFDEEAQGTVGGDGVGVVFLKRLSDALLEHDHIWGVLLGSAINNDGSCKVGFTAPSVDGQATAVAEAYAVAGISAESIGYLEAHGTGTALGDPIEVAALSLAFGADHPKQVCPIGSVKTNIGHLDAAAGIAGLIKSVMVLHAGEIPPTINFKKPNPAIDFANSPFFVNTELIPFRPRGTLRRAGVSSFGIGGTNAHAVLEEPPSRPASLKTVPQLLCLSARSPSALDTMTDELAEALAIKESCSIQDVAYTLLNGRKWFKYRRTVYARDNADAVIRLRDHSKCFTDECKAKDRPVCFMFPGQGTEYANLTKELYETDKTYRANLDQCLKILTSESDDDYISALFPGVELAGPNLELLHQTAITQPILFCVEYCLAQLWIAQGVIPHAMVGHSLGEYVAACISGVMSLRDAIRLIVRRGRLMQSVPPGAMIAVPRGHNELTRFLGSDISIAALNGHRLTILSGPIQDIKDLITILKRARIPSFRLAGSHAFHSRMMASVAHPFLNAVRQIRLAEPKIPFISNVTGKWVQSNEAQDPNYWVAHLLQTVHFPDETSECFKERPWMLLEVGPGQSLAHVFRYPEARNVSVVSTLPKGPMQGESEQFLNALGSLWRLGARINTESIFSKGAFCRESLPTYPFETKRYFASFSKDRPGRPTEESSVASTAPKSFEETAALIEFQLQSMTRHLDQLIHC